MKKINALQKLNNTELMHMQVVYLDNLGFDFDTIHYFTDYAFSTIKTYIKKFAHLLEKAKKIFKAVHTKVIDKVGKGLYLIYDIKTFLHSDRKIFFVKVGETTSSFYKRFKQYSSHNPSFEKIDTYTIEDDDTIIEKEIECHKILNSVCKSIAEDTTEWFEVDRKTFEEIYDKGFAYFGLA